MSGVIRLTPPRTSPRSGVRWSVSLTGISPSPRTVELRGSWPSQVAPFAGVGSDCRTARWGSRGQSRRLYTAHKVAALPLAAVGMFGHATPEYLVGLGDESHVTEWLAAFGRPSQH